MGPNLSKYKTCKYISFERSFASGTESFLKCLKMAFNGKLAKLIVYLSLEFPLVPEPAVQLMIMLTECNDFLRLYQTSKHAFCTMSFPFIFLAFQTPKQGF